MLTVSIDRKSARAGALFFNVIYTLTVRRGGGAVGLLQRLQILCNINAISVQYQCVWRGEEEEEEERASVISLAMNIYQTGQYNSTS